ncbi:NAD-dependent epimerase/dehydratase family protein [Lysinimonas soli]|uniref:NAD-dependent epimerase/dehydratase family protein n=1 Tax=Lysinimonas soli TaxID=1074233 RepID=A0ABW0NTJ6_9MICO
MVFGATGFVGSWTVRALAAAGHDAIAVHRPSSDPWRLQGVPVRRAPSMSDGWAGLIARESPDCIVALDWEGVSASERDQESIQSGNIGRQAALLRAAEESDVGRVVGVGSQAEYGPIDTRTSEQTPTSPVTAYGRAKVQAFEQLVRVREAADRSWVWARVFSVFGPLDSDRTLFPSIADAAASGTRLTIREARQGWSHLYASDAGTALAALATNSSAEGVYNVAHPEAPPLRDSISLFTDYLGGATALEFALNKAAVPPRLAGDTSRLEALGWVASVELATGLELTARWLSGLPVADPFDPSRTLPGRR